MNVYISRKGNSGGIYLNRFLAKNCIYEKSLKKCFFSPNFFNKGIKKKIGQKSPKICQNHLNTCI